MKTIIFFLLLLFAACGEKKYEPADETQSKSAPPFEIEKTETIPGEGEFFYPRYLNDPDKIFFTSANFKGIWYFDKSKGTVTNLTEDNGAGYEIIYSKDTETIYYTTRQIGPDRRTNFKIKKIELGRSGPSEVYSAVDAITNLKISDDSSLIFLEGTNPVKLIFTQNEYKKNGIINASLYRIDGSKLYKNSKGTEELVFNADNNLIWFHQTGEKILIYEASKGCYLISGGRKRFLGDLRNAQLSADGNNIVFMLDEDDGHVITASDIYLTTISNPNKSVNLTKTEDVLEMNPSWSPSGNEIVFNTYDGKIIIAQISEGQTGEKR